MTSQMAKELMLGIRDNVEDIAAAFKKMAVINPERNTAVTAGRQAHGETQRLVPESEVESKSRRQTEAAPMHRRINPPKAAELAEILEKENKARRSKKIHVDENQMTLFDYVA